MQNVWLEASGSLIAYSLYKAFLFGLAPESLRLRQAVLDLGISFGNPGGLFWQSHGIHGTIPVDLPIHEWLICMVNVGKYTVRPMDPSWE